MLRRRTSLKKRIPWIAQEARISSIHHVKKSVRIKDQLLSFYPHITNCLHTISNQKIGEGAFI